jgi:biotin carboxyl carrier protein
MNQLHFLKFDFQSNGAGTVKKIHVKKGQKIDGDDLMVEIE